MRPPCERFVPGYGDPTADFHVVGDHPGIHGGSETDIPFTGMDWSERFYSALQDGGLVRSWAADWTSIEVAGTYLSYRYPCVPETAGPSATAYDELEPYFDAELRAITAHVLLPVGRAAIRHVLESYTALGAETIEERADSHAVECRGSGWLVLTVREPGEWSERDAKSLSASIDAIRSRDYRQTADLGRFHPGGNPYLVR